MQTAALNGKNPATFLNSGEYNVLLATERTEITEKFYGSTHRSTLDRAYRHHAIRPSARWPIQLV